MAERMENWKKCKYCGLEFNSSEEFQKHRDIIIDKLDSIQPLDLSPKKSSEIQKEPLDLSPKKAQKDLSTVRGNSYIISTE